MVKSWRPPEEQKFSDEMSDAEKLKKKSELQRTPHEAELESREVGNHSELGGGCNKTNFVELKDDGSVVFKPKSGEKEDLRNQTEAGTYYKRERAAYLVSRILDFDLVPPTVIREVNGEIGSAQEFIPDAKFYSDYFHEGPKILKSELKKLSVFDYIIWNSDRHDQNFLITSNEKVHAIDNGLSFSQDGLRLFWDDLSPDFFDLPEDIAEKINAFLADPLRKEILSDLLKELLSDAEVRACLKRIEFLGKTFKDKKLIKNTFGPEPRWKVAPRLYNPN